MNPTDRREQRLQSYKKAQSEKEIYERVLAPTLYEFVVWVLQEALQSGKKRLYFLARDGYQMYLAARQLCKQYELVQISQSVEICGACAGISSSRGTLSGTHLCWRNRCDL